jgi:hypothetical protein
VDQLEDDRKREITIFFVFKRRKQHQRCAWWERKEGRGEGGKKEGRGVEGGGKKEKRNEGRNALKDGGAGRRGGGVTGCEEATGRKHNVVHHINLAVESGINVNSQKQGTETSQIV